MKKKEKMKVAFIGLGIMGSRMAHNLIKNGVELKVANRSQAAVEELAAAGAKGASYNEAVQDVDVVVSMLSTPEVVESIFFGPQAALANMKEDTIWVDASTVNPSFSRRAAAAAQQAGIRFLGAPVAGTKPHAENADLVFFVGGAKEDLQEVEVLLNYMGKKVMHVGETADKGAAFKMLVNSLLAQSMLVFAETLHLGEKMGLDKDFLLNTLPNLVVSAPFTKFKAEMIRQDDYSVQFPLEWMQKDLHLVTTTAYEYGQTLYMANIAKEVYNTAKKMGLSREDFAAIYKVFE